MKGVWSNNVLTPGVDTTLFGKHRSQLLFCQPPINNESKRRLIITILYLCITYLLASPNPQKGYFGNSADHHVSRLLYTLWEVNLFDIRVGDIQPYKRSQLAYFTCPPVGKFRIFSFELLTKLRATHSFLSIYLLQNLQIIEVWFNARNAESSTHFNGFNWFQKTNRFEFLFF